MKGMCGACAPRRKCDECAERDFAEFAARCKADAAWQREEALRATIIIDPRPGGREGFRRVGERGHKVATIREREEPETEHEMRRISDRILAARPTIIDSPGEGGWLCPSCGWLGADVSPLIGEHGMHCPRMGCDEMVTLSTQ